jgi:hypothetical protein
MAPYRPFLPTRIHEEPEKISLLQSYLGQFYLPKEFEAAVADAFRDVLKRVDRIAIFLSGARKNDASL